MSRILSIDRLRLQSCKFITDIVGKEKSDENININGIHIGDRLYYWRKYADIDDGINKQFYICPKYKSLKEEIRNNSIHSLSKLQWSDTILRASNLRESNHGKLLISYQGWKNKQSQDYWIKHYNIA